MREAYRPFTKLVSVTGGDPVEVVLHDSAGNALECNYIEVVNVSGGSNADYFLVVPEISTSRSYGDMPEASGITLNDTSGVVGQLVSNSTGTVTISLNSPDLASKIKISHNGGSSVTAYAINYGVVQVSNNLKDSRSPRGN